MQTNAVGLPFCPPRMAALACVLSLACSSATGGCAVGPDFKTPEAPIDADWSPKGDPRIAADTAADALWWRGFRDPVLDRLIELAYKENLPLQIAGLRIVEARAQLGIATGSQFPQVQEAFGSAAAVGLTQQQANIVSPDRLTRNFLTYQVGFDAAWELDLWGKYRRGVQAEAANLLATVADYYSALVSLTAEVARTYASVRTFEVLIEQARENVRLQEDGLRITQSRFRNGVAPELDVTQATTLLDGTRASVPQLEISERQARNALSTLLGQPAGRLDGLLAGPADIPTAPVKINVVIPAEMLRRRPDIRSAQLRAAAQCALIGVAKAELYPSFSLVGTVGLRAASSGLASHNLFTGDSFFYSAGPQINWPFFEYGRLQNGVRVQDARLQQLLVEYKNVVLKAAQEVEDALVEFLNSQEAVVYEQSSVKSAQRSVEISIAAYQQGAVDYQRVLDAQRSLLAQENALTQARSSVATGFIAVYKALGGGWELGEGQPFVPEATKREMKERTHWGDLLSQPRAPEARKKPPGTP